MTYRAVIPYGAYWSTPFARWQGAFANLHSIEFAAHVARQELAKRKIDPKVFDYGVLGFSVPQKFSFYGLPWLAGLIGAGQIGGPTLMQACATGVRTLLAGAQEIESGLASATLVVNCDRTSNGPHLYYPNPKGPGGTGSAEDWVMDNFGCDPLGKHSMLATAENVAKKHGLGTALQHEVVLHREGQYREALAQEASFLKRFMTLPFAVPAPNFKKDAGSLEADEGINFSNSEGLAKLKPVMEGGTVTFGGQTHPADGNAGLVLTTEEKARELSRDSKIVIRLLGFGLARVPLAFMPEATVPAAKQALAQAGKKMGDLVAIKTHNPFAVNDLFFAKETGTDWRRMNNYGCSLVWGHPQAPMGTRAVIELIEELVQRGGGVGLFTGCAAGDTAMAVVLSVGA
ncbi:acetyl-CoA C-acetyltransferase [Burkholderiales bacterium]|nr:MAG: thiolase family protein [Burkholderiales bacterium]CAG0979419.1 acetyl-CoA C-acetyltransferase [Burkholderiales bacterium]